MEKINVDYKPGDEREKSSLTFQGAQTMTQFFKGPKMPWSRVKNAWQRKKTA